MSVITPGITAQLTGARRRPMAQILRTDKAAVVLLLVSTVAALVWANSPLRDGYLALGRLVVGPSALHLDLSIATWATDGLLAVFFFVVGLELKREIVAGELRRLRTAIVPVVAAIGGMLVPALLYTLVNTLSANGAPQGWAVPVATDIAFAVAVLSAFGRHLPLALRTFLLTLAVADDLLGIIVIAVFYGHSVELAWLGAAVLAVVAFALAVRTRWGSPWLLVPLAVTAWATMHASGIHATIAGVALGLSVPATARASSAARSRLAEGESLAERFEHLWRPVSAGLAVPIFALFAAGVRLDGAALVAAAQDPAAQGAALALVLGKPIGIVAAAWVLTRFTRASLAPGLAWSDIAPVAVVAGIGFTVSLLIAELSFTEGPRHDAVKAAVLIGSTAAAAVGGMLLAARSRHHLRSGVFVG